MSMWNKPIVFVLIISGIVFPEIVGYLRSDYHFFSNYLSELGAIGTPYSSLVKFAGFLPVGLAVSFLVIVLLQQLPRISSVRAGLICLLGVSVGYFGAVLFPCDYGCPADGGIRQSIHNLAGLIQYAGAIIGLFLIFFGLRSTASRAFRFVTLTAALAVTSGFVLMLAPDLQQARGVTQRLADYSIFLWFGYAVLSNPASLRKTGPNTA